MGETIPISLLQSAIIHESKMWDTVISWRYKTHQMFFWDTETLKDFEATRLAFSRIKGAIFGYCAMFRSLGIIEPLNPPGPRLDPLIRFPTRGYGSSPRILSEPSSVLFDLNSVLIPTLLSTSHSPASLYSNGQTTLPSS